MSTYGIRCTRTNYSCPDRLSPSLKAAQKKNNLGRSEMKRVADELDKKDKMNQKKRADHALWVREQIQTQETVEWQNFKSIVDILDPLHARINSWDEPSSPQDHLNYAAIRERFVHQASVLGLDSEYTFDAMYGI